MKLLKNVLLKLSRGGSTDRVIFVDNLPEDLLYSMQYPKVVALMRKDDTRTQYWTSDTTKPKVMTLHEELKKSPVGDDGIVFNMDNNNAKDRWKAVDSYIKANYPSGKLPPAPKPYSVDPTDPRSAVLPLSEIPRIVLPVLSPSDSSDAGNASAGDSKSESIVDLDAVKKQAIEEYKKEQKAKASERMAKARAARSK